MKIQLVKNSLLRLSAILLLACAWINVSAAPEAPPLFCVDDNCVNTPDGPAPGGNYTLASIGSVPFAYSTPALPRITSEATVTPATLAANKVNGRRVILSAGNYGDQSFSTQDQEFVFQNGAVMGRLNFANSAARLRFTSVNPRQGVVSYIGAELTRPSDIMFDGMTFAHINGGNTTNFLNGNRWAIINCDMTAMSFIAFVTGSNDLVIANNKMLAAYPRYFGQSGTPQAAVRLHGVRRLVFVDNFLTKLQDPNDGGRHTFRIHGMSAGGQTAHDLYIANNVFAGPGTGMTAAPQETDIETVWWENNTHYVTPGVMLMIVESADLRPPRVMIIRNNRAYGDSTQWPTARAGWTVQNNSSESYRTPPPWSFQ